MGVMLLYKQLKGNAWGCTVSAFSLPEQAAWGIQLSLATGCSDDPAG
jgi:hypothetical protein